MLYDESLSDNLIKLFSEWLFLSRNTPSFLSVLSKTKDYNKGGEYNSTLC